MLYALIAMPARTLLAADVDPQALPTPPANSLVKPYAEWDAVPVSPLVWSPEQLNWAVPVAERVGWAPLTFRWRYSPEEQVLLEMVAWGTYGTFTDAQRAELRVIEKSLDAVQTFVYHDDPRTVYGVGKHVAFGLITSQRAAEILDPLWSPPWAPV